MSGRYFTRKKKIDLQEKSDKSCPEKDVGGDKCEKALSAEKAEVESAVETEKDKSPDSPQSQTNSSSPELTCAICLSNLENKSFTDSCFHQFCFVCLLEWSKVKSECPLCKQPFQSIIHNVRSYEDYDQYHIQRQDDQSGHRFRYPTTRSHHYAGHDYAQDQGHPSHRDSRDLFGFSENASRTNWRRFRQAATSDFRRRIYQNNLYVVDGGRHSRRRLRVRDISPAFFRSNPACTHRLVPWLNRELNALPHNHEGRTQFLLELILGLITRYEISSEEYYQHVFPFIGRNTRHFMHEFEHFAKSAYHMQAYDQHAIYEPQTQDIDSDSSSSYGSDVMIISSPRGSEHRTSGNDQPLDLRQIPLPPNVIACEPPTTSTFTCLSMPRVSLPSMTLPTWLNSISPIQFARPNPPHLSNFSPLLQQSLSTSGWESPIPGPSWFEANTSLQPIESEGLQTETSQVQSEVVVKSEDKTVTVWSSGHSDSESGSAVIFVQYDKPWEDRSPIMVSTSTDDEDHCRAGVIRSSKAKRKSSDSAKLSKLEKDEYDKDIKRTVFNRNDSQQSSRIKQRSKSRSRSCSRSLSSHCKSSKCSRTKTHQRDSRSCSVSSSRSSYRYAAREKSTRPRKHSRKESSKYDYSSHKSGLKSRSGERSRSRSRSWSRSWSRTRYVSRLHSGGSLCVSFVASHRHPEYFSKSQKRSRTRSPSSSLEYVDHQYKRSKKRKEKKHKKKHKKHKKKHDSKDCDSETDLLKSSETGKKKEEEQSKQTYKKHPTGHKNATKKSRSNDVRGLHNQQVVLRRILMAGQSTAGLTSDPKPEEIIHQNDSNSKVNIHKESELVIQPDVPKVDDSLSESKPIGTQQRKQKQLQNTESINQLEYKDEDLLTDKPFSSQLVSTSAVQELQYNQQTLNTVTAGNRGDKILKKSSRKGVDNIKVKKLSSSKHNKSGSRKHRENKSDEHSNTVLKAAAKKSSGLLEEKSSEQLQEEYMGILQIWRNLSKQEADVSTATEIQSSVAFPVDKNTAQSQKPCRSSNRSNASTGENKSADNEKATNANCSKHSNDGMKKCTGHPADGRNTSFEKDFTHSKEEQGRRKTDELQAQSVTVENTRQYFNMDGSSIRTSDQTTASPIIDPTHLSAVSNMEQESARVNFSDSYFDMFEEISDEENFDELCAEDNTVPASSSPKHNASVGILQNLKGQVTSGRSKRIKKYAHSDISEGEIVSDSDQDSDVHVIRGEWNTNSKPIDIGSRDSEEEGELKRTHDITHNTGKKTINRTRSITIGSSSSDIGKCPENNPHMLEKEHLKNNKSKNDLYESISIISSDTELSDGEIVDDTNSEEDYVTSSAHWRKSENYNWSAGVLNRSASNVRKSNPIGSSDNQSEQSRMLWGQSSSRLSNVLIKNNKSETQIKDSVLMSEHRLAEGQSTAESYVFGQKQMLPLNSYSDEDTAVGISNLLCTSSEKCHLLVNEKVTDTENVANDVSSPVNSRCEVSHSDDTEIYSLENNPFKTTNSPGGQQVNEELNVEKSYADHSFCSTFGVTHTSSIEQNSESEKNAARSNSKDGQIMKNCSNAAKSSESNKRPAIDVHNLSSEILQDPSLFLLDHIFEQSGESDKERRDENKETDSFTWYSDQESEEHISRNDSDSESESVMSRTDGKGTKHNTESENENETEKTDEEDLKNFPIWDGEMLRHNSNEKILKYSSSESEENYLENKKFIPGNIADLNSEEKVCNTDDDQNNKGDAVEPENMNLGCITCEKMPDNSNNKFLSKSLQSAQMPASCEDSHSSEEGEIHSSPMCSDSE